MTTELEANGEITKDDVFGTFCMESMKMTDPGMVVGNSKLGGFNEKTCSSNDPCPIFGDLIPYKSVTVVCNEEQLEQVEYWLSYVHGGDCISKQKTLDDGRIATRSDYQCW